MIIHENRSDWFKIGRTASFEVDLNIDYDAYAYYTVVVHTLGNVIITRRNDDHRFNNRSQLSKIDVSTFATYLPRVGRRIYETHVEFSLDTSGGRQHEVDVDISPELTMTMTNVTTGEQTVVQLADVADDLLRDICGL